MARWDKKCLEPGVSWEDGFCDGLVQSRIFLPLLSRAAIRHPDERRQNFEMHEADSPCDNLLLEMRLSLELFARGLIDRVYPVMIGDKRDGGGGGEAVYGNYFGNGCHPVLKSKVVVASVEKQLEEHLGRLSLGTPLLCDMPVSAILQEICKNQGKLFEGNVSNAVHEVCMDVLKMKELAMEVQAKA